MILLLTPSWWSLQKGVHCSHYGPRKMSADDKYFYLSYHWFKELQDDDIIDMKGVKLKFSLSDVFTGKYAEANGNFRMLYEQARIYKL